jgi:hypothetical protein
MKLGMGKSQVKYSPQEEKMFHLLTDKPQDSAILRKRFYGMKAPFHARAAIIAVLNNLSRKVEANAEPFEIKQSPRAGPSPSSFWLEKRGKQ